MGLSPLAAKGAAKGTGTFLPMEGQDMSHSQARERLQRAGIVDGLNSKGIGGWHFSPLLDRDRNIAALRLDHA